MYSPLHMLTFTFIGLFIHEMIYSPGLLTLSEGQGWRTMLFRIVMCDLGLWLVYILPNYLTFKKVLVTEECLSILHDAGEPNIYKMFAYKLYTLLKKEI